MHNESGRSLVEILAILSIIGIISIAGIVGYKLAVYRYSASKIVDTTNKYAFIIFERCRSVYDAHTTSLQSIANCTKNTPHIPKFTETNLGNTPAGIFENGILFNRISKDSDSDAHNIHFTLKFETKEHCLAVKYMQNIKDGCRETSAPFSLSVETRGN